MIKQTAFVVAGAIAVGLGMTDTASAVVSCDIGNLAGSVQCEGTFSGNDANSDLSGAFGFDSWTEAFKIDGGSGSDGGLTVTDGGKTGSYSLGGLEADYTYMVALKGGPSYSLYLLGDGSQSYGGDWNTDDLFKGNGKAGPNLSHLTVYKTRVDEPKPEKVPEPISVLGVFAFGAIATGGALKRKLSS